MKFVARSGPGQMSASRPKGTLPDRTPVARLSALAGRQPWLGNFLAECEERYRPPHGLLDPSATAVVQSSLRCGDIAAAVQHIPPKSQNALKNEWIPVDNPEGEID